MQNVPRAETSSTKRPTKIDTHTQNRANATCGNRLFFVAPSFEAWETHRYLESRLGIFRARGGGLLDHPCAPRHHPSVSPTEEHLVGHLTNYCHPMNNYAWYILFPCHYILYHVVTECINGCCKKVFISFTDQVMLGSGTLFFIMSIWSDVVAWQSVIRWCNVSLACKHSLQVGSISVLSLDWK